jgi:hypothetical protein
MNGFWGCSPCRRWSVRVRGGDQHQVPELSDVRIALVLSGHDAGG